ncbi:DUF6887 family protein [Chamaesiphon sp. OTE_75_metabat_556]|uniref:DUF6887 family protein n=1 Tax=Chamaesiphon sp. OTE_75_metabat_556 TaxID=2964692 RepID=UPI00286C280E|nr:hypothetical protein [Chamaesiphon sp. OTE_75_metabat_556]
MSQINYRQMNQKELRDYVLTHREDEAAFYAYVDLLHAEVNWVEMPALESEQDLENYPEFLDLIRKNSKN